MADSRKEVDEAFAKLGADVAATVTELQKTGTCDICGKSAEKNGRLLARDHHHTSKRPRGILCLQCNMAIGLIGDDPSVARRIVEYLEKAPVSYPDEMVDFSRK